MRDTRRAFLCLYKGFLLGSDDQNVPRFDAGVPLGDDRFAVAEDENHQLAAGGGEFRDPFFRPGAVRGDGLLSQQKTRRLHEGAGAEHGHVPGLQDGPAAGDDALLSPQQHDDQGVRRQEQIAQGFPHRAAWCR